MCKASFSFLKKLKTNSVPMKYKTYSMVSEMKSDSVVAGNSLLSKCNKIAEVKAKPAISNVLSALVIRLF